MDRAQLGGIDDVGIGVLFGLENYKYDFMGLMMHAEHLEARFGVGPHTISVPRIRPADDIDPEDFDNSISDDIFAKIVACIRIATPYTGMIISTRESKETREKVLELGYKSNFRRIQNLSRWLQRGFDKKRDPKVASNLIHQTKEVWMRLSTGSSPWDTYLHFVQLATEREELETGLCPW
jgi:hypothetical protein